jgi:uncharacterized protein (TIGR03437 family)
MVRFCPCKLLFALWLCIPLYSQSQIGGGTCTNATFTGTYYYVVSGDVASGMEFNPYAEMGQLVADGHGNVSGRSQASVGGSLTSYTLVGTYSVQTNCAGTLTLTANSKPTAPITFQVLNGGEGAVIAYSQQSAVITGRAYRSDEAGQCGNGSLSGGYAFLLTGVDYISGNEDYYSSAGNMVSDGNGNLTSVVSTVNINGTTAIGSATGSYSLQSDCSGTARVSGSSGTTNYSVAVVENGQAIVFLETDTNTTVGGTAQPQFAAPQQAIVNSASFAPESLSAGSIFSVFGVGLSQQTASAQKLPLPLSLGSTAVLVNGNPAPLFYVSPGQINAQIPLDAPTGTPVSVIVTSAEKNSNTATVDLGPAAPGVFTYGNNEAIVQNPDGSLNSATNPAHSGDVLVGYLTGGGPVNPAGPLITGAASPNGPSPATLDYSVTVGGLQAEVSYLGLTPTLVGVYQVNFQLPQLAAGQYPLVVSVDNIPSNGPTISVGQ